MEISKVPNDASHKILPTLTSLELDSPLRHRTDDILITGLTGRYRSV